MSDYQPDHPPRPDLTPEEEEQVEEESPPTEPEKDTRRNDD